MIRIIVNSTSKFLYDHVTEDTGKYRNKLCKKYIKKLFYLVRFNNVNIFTVLFE